MRAPQDPLSVSASHVPKAGRTILGHPPGLFLLFFTEMWERFSYYGMRSLLVLYMVDHLFLRPDVTQKVVGFGFVKGTLETLFGPLAIQPLSSQIYGLYTAFVYLTPLFGGMLADRVLGQRRTVVLGAVLMAIGHFLMAVESLFFLALLFLIAGNGAFKPNISTQVGSLYPPGDPRRDRAFTIFYMGINLGAFLSPLICGTLGQRYGWHYGFGAAGVGMVLGLCLYLAGQRYLAPDLIMRRKENGLVAAPAKQPLTREEWKRVWALAALCGLNVIFWAVYEQQGNTMQLWADRNANWTFGGIRIPSTWYQAFNPAMIFIFAPLLNVFWGWQSRRNREPSSVIKMSIGCVLLGLSFLVMIAGSHGMTPDERRSVLWLAGTTLVLTVGELYLSPIGLSLVTKVAPARIASMTMGIWFLSSFFGNYLSGFLGTFWEKMPRGGFFLMLCVLGVAAGLAIYAVSRPLNRIVRAHDIGAA
ncbi:MAG: peptide MFS transporter [Candidatus Eisenbacteria bacterium]|nr:peptide MFS transporter [Candidatus Eisenbacteria bacterium]